MPRRSKQIPAAGRKWAHLDTITGTPDLSGGNTRRLHTCRMNPAFHADAASCIGGSVRVRPSEHYKDDSLCSSQALSPESGSLAKLEPPAVGGFKTYLSFQLLISECPSANEIPPAPPWRVAETLIQ